MIPAEITMALGPAATASAWSNADIAEPTFVIGTGEQIDGKLWGRRLEKHLRRK